jgi:hypothetical protein
LVSSSFDLPRLGPNLLDHRLKMSIDSSEALKLAWTKVAQNSELMVNQLQQAQRKLSKNEDAANVTVTGDAQSELDLFGDCVNLASTRSTLGISLSAVNALVSGWQSMVSNYRFTCDLLVCQARLVFSTVSCAARSSIVSAEQLLRSLHTMKEKWNVPKEILELLPISSVVIDEAAQLVEAYVPIAFFRNVTRLYLIGDTRQLKATVIGEALVEREYARSLYERIEMSNWPVHLLSSQ